MLRHGINPGAERSRDSRRGFLRSGVEQTAFEDTAGYLQELVDEGTIRHVGVSTDGSEEMAAFERTRPVETLQPPYHLFRRPIESDVLPYARQRGIGVLASSPLGSGLLTGAMDASTTFEESPEGVA